MSEKFLTRNQIENEIPHLFKNNFTIREICHHYEKNYTTIYRALKKVDVKKKTINECLQELKIHK